MIKFRIFTITSIIVLLGTLLTSAPAFAQIDLSGGWGFVRGQYGQENAGGSDIGAFTGIPINDEGRAVGLSFSAAQSSGRDRQRQYYSPRYTSTGPFALSGLSATEPAPRTALA